MLADLGPQADFRPGSDGVDHASTWLPPDLGKWQHDWYDRDDRNDQDERNKMTGMIRKTRMTGMTEMTK